MPLRSVWRLLISTRSFHAGDDTNDLDIWTGFTVYILRLFLLFGIYSQGAYNVLHGGMRMPIDNKE